MADSAEVMASFKKQPGVVYPVLVPNEKGYDNAVKAGNCLTALHFIVNVMQTIASCFINLL